MSVETPPEPESHGSSAVLRREALLPNERSRGLGTVAVVCTMAGVASGLALATTLMAMQVADSMSVRTCPYRVVAADVQTVDLSVDHGFLGVVEHVTDGVAVIDKVLPGTPAEANQIEVGDQVLSIDGSPLRSTEDFVQRIATMHPGARPTIVVEHDGQPRTIRPALIAWPAVSIDRY